jgi:predicted glycoside hydrolase/deacetylase ChbG (UPF0249 family)
MCGRPPDFAIDGHQRSSVSQIRDAFSELSQGAPEAWVRQCGRAKVGRHLHDRKALTLDVLSVGFRRKAKKLGVKFNPGFAGTYDFNSRANFEKIFPRFLSSLPNGGLVMCHPGFADDALKSLDR